MLFTAVVIQNEGVSLPVMAHKDGFCIIHLSLPFISDHVESLSAMQRLQGLANQLHQDILSLDNHKYVAHQLSLLHVSLLWL